MATSKRVILVTGTPCVGKTTISRLLTDKLNALYVNLTELAVHKNLLLGKDEERNTLIVDEKRLRKKLRQIIKETETKDAVIDGHYAVNVAPKNLVTHVFVLRRDPVELKKRMEQAGFSGRKLWENLSSEILDVCLIDALDVYEKERICELDVSDKSAKEVLSMILKVLKGAKKCGVGTVDWISKLENAGVLDEFLKT
jgi:adenylate kinase